LFDGEGANPGPISPAWTGPFCDAGGDNAPDPNNLANAKFATRGEPGGSEGGVFASGENECRAYDYWDWLKNDEKPWKSIWAVNDPLRKFTPVKKRSVVFCSDINPEVTVCLHVHPDIHGAAADFTVFDVLLFVKRQVNENRDRFSAIRAAYG